MSRVPKFDPNPPAPLRKPALPLKSLLLVCPFVLSCAVCVVNFPCAGGRSFSPDRTVGLLVDFVVRVDPVHSPGLHLLHPGRVPFVRLFQGLARQRRALQVRDVGPLRIVPLLSAWFPPRRLV